MVTGRHGEVEVRFEVWCFGEELLGGNQTRNRTGGSWMEYVLAIYSTYFMVFIHKSKYHSPTKKAYLENWDWEP